MKSLLLIVCISSSIIIFPQLHAMDFDDDKTIPLKTISQKPISLNRQFSDFEQKLSAELNQDNWLLRKEILPDVYIKKLHTELPAIFASERTIEKFSRIQNSYLAKAVNELIDYGYDHYKKVNASTLANIRNPKEQQPCTIFNGLPSLLKQYIMQKAYHTMKQNFVLLALPTIFDIKDIHAKIGVVATINKTLKTFDVFNIKTNKVIFSIPNASDTSLIRFSEDSSILITTNSLPENPTTTYINLWDTTTKKSLMVLRYFNTIKNVFLKKNILHVIEETGYLYTARIDINKMQREVLSRINAGIQTITPPFTHQEKYHIDNNVILKKSFSYFLCTQAIKNTSDAISLKKIYDTPFYKSASLTDDQRKMIHKKIEAKIKKLNVQNEQTNNLMNWFG